MSNLYGTRIREERKSKNLNQKELSYITKISPQTLIRYEKNNRYPDAHFLEQLSQIGFDIQYIITGTRADSPTLSADELNVLHLYRNSSMQIKSACIAMLESGIKSHNHIQISQSSEIDIKIK